MNVTHATDTDSTLPTMTEDLETARTEDHPLVSIGLPVYNAEEYLESALDSILSQTFDDFELIISDNASTDRTPQIIERFLATDNRIRYYRNAENIGGANNHNRVFRIARGKYFRWAAHDDICSPTLIQECLSVLEARPDAVLCYTHTVEIDAKGHTTGCVEITRGSAATPSARLKQLAYRNHKCEASYGLIRSDVLRTTHLEGSYTNSDRVLLCELAMHGEFAIVPQPLFFKRYHSRNDYTDWRSKMTWFDRESKRKRRITTPNWLEMFALIRVVATAPLDVEQRLRSAVVVARWIVAHRYELLLDLTTSARTALANSRPLARDTGPV